MTPFFAKDPGETRESLVEKYKAVFEKSGRDGWYAYATGLRAAAEVQALLWQSRRGRPLAHIVGGGSTSPNLSL